MTNNKFVIGGDFKIKYELHRNDGTLVPIGSKPFSLRYYNPNDLSNFVIASFDGVDYVNMIPKENYYSICIEKPNFDVGRLVCTEIIREVDLDFPDGFCDNASTYDVGQIVKYVAGDTVLNTQVNFAYGVTVGLPFRYAAALPAVGEKDILYFIPNNEISDLYIFENGEYVKVGNTTINMDNFFTKDEINGILEEYATLQQLATNLANYYLKTEINDIVSGLNQLTPVIVTSVDEVVDGKILYFIPRKTQESKNLYDQYMYIDGRPEKIGDLDTTIDLREYVLSSTFTSTINGLANIYVAKETGKELIPATALLKLNNLPNANEIFLKSSLVEDFGSDSTKVMSQKAVTDELAVIANSKPTIFEGYAYLPAGVETLISGTSFTPVLNLRPVNIQVFYDGMLKTVAGRYVVNGDNYDVYLTATEYLMGAEITIIGTLLKHFEPELTAYMAGLTTELSSADEDDYNILIRTIKRSLKINSLQDKFFFLYPLAGDTQANSLHNLVNDSYHATMMNDAIFESYAGITGVPENLTHIKTGFIPSIHAPENLNNLSFGIYLSQLGVTEGQYGVYDNALNFIAIWPNYDAATILAYLNSTGNVSLSPQKKTGLINVSRNDAATLSLNASLRVQSEPKASTGLPSREIYILARNNKGTAELFASDKVSFAYLGKHLDRWESANLNGAMNDYLFRKGKTVDPVLFYRGYNLTNDPTKYQSFGNIAIDSLGRLYVVYRTSTENIHGYSPYGKCVMKISTDSGVTWSDEIIVVDEPDIDDRNACILIFEKDGIEKILVTYNDNNGSYDNYCGVLSTTSAPSIWTNKIVIGDDGARANPIMLSNGKILAPGYYYAYESSDNGVSWDSYDLADAAVIGQVSEPTFLECKTNGSYQGKVIAIFRRNNFNNLISYSYDYGHTWSNLVSTQINGVMGHLLRYNDNTILLFIGGSDPVYQPFGGLRIWKSTDEGDTWTTAAYFGAGAIPVKCNPSVVHMGNNHFGFNWSPTGDVTDIYFFDLIIDPDKI